MQTHYLKSLRGIDSEDSQPESGDGGDSLLRVAALEEKVNQLLGGVIDSESVTAGSSTGSASTWHIMGTTHSIEAHHYVYKWTWKKRKRDGKAIAR